MTRPEATDRTISADHRDKNVRREIDITKNHTAEETINDIAAHFIRLRSAQEGRSVYPSPRDYQAIARIVSLGASAQEAIKWLGECFTAFEQRRTSSAETIKAFSYCAKYMEDRLNARIAGRTITTKKRGIRYMTKRTIEQILADLKTENVHYWRTDRKNQTKAALTVRSVKIRAVISKPAGNGCVG